MTLGCSENRIQTICFRLVSPDRERNDEMPIYKAKRKSDKQTWILVKANYMWDIVAYLDDDFHVAVYVDESTQNQIDLDLSDYRKPKPAKPVKKSSRPSVIRQVGESIFGYKRKSSPDEISIESQIPNSEIRGNEIKMVILDELEDDELLKQLNAG